MNSKFGMPYAYEDCIKAEQTGLKTSSRIEEEEEYKEEINTLSS